MNKNIAIGDIKNHPNNHYELHMITLPAGTRLGYKVITAESEDNYANYKTAFKNSFPTLRDFSGTYINDSIITALGYCDKAFSKIQLIEVCTKKELKLVDCPDYLNAIKPNNNNPIDKENQPNGQPEPIDLLKSELSKINITEYIVNDIGKKLGSAFLSWDAESYEIVFPHSLNQSDFLTITPIATIKTTHKYGTCVVTEVAFNDQDPIEIKKDVHPGKLVMENNESIRTTFPAVNFDELRKLPKTKIV